MKFTKQVIEDWRLIDIRIDNRIYEILREEKGIKVLWAYSHEVNEEELIFEYATENSVTLRGSMPTSYLWNYLPKDVTKIQLDMEGTMADSSTTLKGGVSSATIL